MSRSWVIGVLSIAGFSVLLLYSLAPLFLPPPQPASVPASRFSAGRAMQHVDVMSQFPRRASTPGMDQAAAYIVSSLRSCALLPEIQSSQSSRGTLHNVVVRIPGAQAGSAVLLVSHVDSISYGAGDNASGAAVLLEAACALRAGQQLQHDVILLFEDGEEAGYLGGYAFATSGTSMSAIRLVIGLDTAAWGPVVLLQTTPGNSQMVQAYARSVEHPVAFGFFADADWNISRDSSEIQPFYERGIPGLELEDPTAFTGKHTEADTADRVRPGSLQQMGDQLLAMARLSGDDDVSPAAPSELSYFTLWGLPLVRYLAGGNMLLAFLSLVALGVLVMRSIRQRQLSLRPLLAAAAALLLACIGAALAGAFASLVFSKLFPNPNPNTGSYLIRASLPFFLFMVVLIPAAYLLLRQRIAGRFGSPALALAGLFPWLLLAIAASALLPVGSSILALPLSAAVLAHLLPPRLAFTRIFAAALATILFAPNIALAFIATGMQTLVLVSLLLAINAEMWAGAGFPRLGP